MIAAPMPRSVAWLGYAGLLPFVALALACLLDASHRAGWQHHALNYGAVILSFVGALHWGFAISAHAMSERKRRACYAWSVMPALIAWLALMLDPFAASAMLAAGFALHYVQDWRLVRHAGLPAWYLPLRLRLSLVAIVSLLVTGLAPR